jgi:hypothetical protein
MRFDNATNETSPLTTTESTTPSIAAPPSLPTAPGSYIQVDLSVDSAGHETWRRPIHTWFRRGGDGWTLVGLERLPDAIASDRASHAKARG